MTSDEIIEDYDLTENPDNRINCNNYVAHNILESTVFKLNGFDIQNKEYIVLVANDRITIVDTTVNKEPQYITSPYYFGCTVYAPDTYFAVFEAGKQFRDLENEQ